MLNLLLEEQQVHYPFWNMVYVMTRDDRLEALK